MPTDAKPLFRPEAVRPKVRAFALPPHADRGKIAKWAKMFTGSGRVKFKETEVRDEFRDDIYRDVLGDVTVSETPEAYSFKKELFVEAAGTYADAGFGRFGTGPDAPRLVLEGKGPLDPLDRPDAVCEGFKKLAEYHYGDAADGLGKLIDVKILGHVFEQSISDLEEKHRSVTPAVAGVAAVEPGEPTKRKKEGAFYTPAFVTRYIPTETLGDIVRDRFERYRERLAASTQKFAKLFADPNDLEAAEKTAANRIALWKFWAGWLEELETIRIVDPACGSGAAIRDAHNHPANNIYGMDLNSEAVPTVSATPAAYRPPSPGA